MAKDNSPPKKLSLSDLAAIKLLGDKIISWGYWWTHEDKSILADRIEEAFLHSGCGWKKLNSLDAILKEHESFDLNVVLRTNNGECYFLAKEYPEMVEWLKTL